MKAFLGSLHPYEFEGLLNALRRDMRMQLELSRPNTCWTERYLSNARMDKRLLEALNPKKSAFVNDKSTALEADVPANIEG